MKPAFELAEVIERFGNSYSESFKPNTYVQRVLNAIKLCRTSALGGHVDCCEECGHIRISYNSCRNRHCPKCQNTQREAWIADRNQQLLPVNYFHVVFTVPDKLNRLFLLNPPVRYNLLFRSAWDTMAQFFLTKLQAESGMTAVLHTWGQNLSLHPHLHCIVPGGGISVTGNWKQVNISKNGKVYLFPVEQLSAVFRGKFMERLQLQMPVDPNLKRELYKNNWVVYTKEPFAGPEAIVEYLGRYSHKVAISNHRILGIVNKGVSYRWLDYRDNKQKIMHLEGREFLRRFSQHILPKGFVRIRYFGILSSTRKNNLQQLQLTLGMIIKETGSRDWKEICRTRLNYDPDLCPHCGKGKMITLKSIDRTRNRITIISGDSVFHCSESHFHAISIFLFRLVPHQNFKERVYNFR